MWHLGSILTIIGIVLQFSVTEHYTAGDHGPRFVPGVFFFYDLSPIKVLPHEFVFKFNKLHRINTPPVQDGTHSSVVFYTLFFPDFITFGAILRYYNCRKAAAAERNSLVNMLWISYSGILLCCVRLW